MKKFFIGILVVMTCVIAGSAMASTASAANCTYSNANVIYWTGYLTFEGYVGGCDANTDLIQFTNAGAGAYIYDYSIGQYKYSVATSGAETQTNPGNNGSRYRTYYVPAYCGGAVHAVINAFSWRIHNRPTNSWGSWHATGSAIKNINC